MYYASGVRTLYAVSINVAHYVMADFLLSLAGDVIVDVIGVRFEFVYLFLRYIKTQLPFGFGESYPKASPCRAIYRTISYTW